MSASNPRNILFVDDVAEEADFYAEHLRRLPELALTTAVSAEEALETLHDSDVDCLVSDSVHTADGESLVEVAKRSYPDLPVVLHSGRSPTELPTEVVDAYLPKGGSTDTTGSSDALDALGDVVRELTDRTHRSGRSDTSQSSAEWRHLGTFDWTDESPSIQLIKALTARTDFDPLATVPLYETIEPEALDTLLSRAVAGENRSAVVLDFRISEYRLRLSSDGRVEYMNSDESDSSPSGDADQ